MNVERRFFHERPLRSSWRNGRSFGKPQSAGPPSRTPIAPGCNSEEVRLLIEPMRGGFVIPLKEAWQMVLISTLSAAEQRVQRTLATLRKNWRTFVKRQSR